MPINIGSYSSGSSLDEVLANLQSQESIARASNLQRKEQIEAIFDEVIARYGSEGTYGRAAELLIGQQKVRDVGATAQRDISRGMYGVRPYEQEWEAAVGAPARLKLEDIKMERLSQAQYAKAGFLTGIEEEYPDYGLVAQLAAQASQSGGGAVGGYGGGGGSSEQYQGTYMSPDWPPKAEEGGYVQGTGAGAIGGRLYQSAVTGEIKEFSADEAANMGYAWTPASSKAYEQYQANLAKTQGAGVTVATPEEYAKIQKQLQELYGKSTAADIRTSGWRQYGAWSI